MLLVGRSILGCHHVQVVPAAPQHLLARRVDVSAIGLVDEGQPTVGTESQYVLRLRLDQRTVAGLAGAQGEFAVSLVGDVPADRLDLDQLPLVIEQRRIGPLYPCDTAV